MLKINLKKANSSKEWPFIEHMLNGLGFPQIFVGWIMEYTIVLYSVMINADSTIPFQARKGLRQGDPLFSYVFAFGMEYLSRSFNILYKKPSFGYHPRCKRDWETHLMFAFVVLLFYKADVLSMEMLMDKFQHFSK